MKQGRKKKNNLLIRLLSIWFPELNLYTSKHGAKIQWGNAVNGMLSKWITRIGMGSILIIPVIIVFGFPYLPNIATYLLIFAVTWQPIVVIVLLTRNYKEIRRHLRWALRSENIYLCLECGYNLCGNESNYCPECNTIIFTSNPPKEILPY